MARLFSVVMVCVMLGFGAASAAEKKWEKVAPNLDFSNAVDIVGWKGAIWCTTKNGTMYKVGEDGTAAQVGEAGDMKDSVVTEVMGDSLFTIEKDGSLWRMDKEGSWEQIQEKFAESCTSLTALDGMLWTLESGTLYKSTTKAEWEMVGKEGAFKNVTDLVGLNGALYGVTKDGGLIKIAKDGAVSKIHSNGEWKNTVILISHAGYLWSVEDDGTLYRTNAAGEYEEVGAKALKNIKAMGALKNYIYVVAGKELYRIAVDTQAKAAK